MTWTNDNQCPVCEGTSMEALPKMGDATEVICKNCGRFRITDSAKAEFRHKDVSAKQAFLAEAKEKASMAREPIAKISTYS